MKTYNNSQKIDAGKVTGKEKGECEEKLINTSILMEQKT